MTIIHIVMFGWKSTATQEQIEETCKAMLVLGQKCIHPTSQLPYIKSASGGRNNSPEGLAGPFTHGFVVEFENAEDRDYYLNKDPAHLAFVKSAGEVAQSVQVLDYTPGKL